MHQRKKGQSDGAESWQYLWGLTRLPWPRRLVDGMTACYSSWSHPASVLMLESCLQHKLVRQFDSFETKVQVSNYEYAVSLEQKPFKRLHFLFWILLPSRGMCSISSVVMPNQTSFAAWLPCYLLDPPPQTSDQNIYPFAELKQWYIPRHKISNRLSLFGIWIPSSSSHLYKFEVNTVLNIKSLWISGIPMQP